MRKCLTIKFFFITAFILVGTVGVSQTDSTFTDSTLVDHTFSDSLTLDSSSLDSSWTDSSAVEAFSDSTAFSDSSAFLSDSAFLNSFSNTAESDNKPDLLFLEALSMRIINGQTTHTLEKGQLEFCVQHRFGEFSTGKYELYGLDQSRVRIGFDYGITDKITVGVGRSSMGKVYNAYFKASLAKQDNNHKFSYTWVSDMYISGLKNTDPDLSPYYNTHRYKYTNQLLVSHAFGQRAVITLAPTVVHRNFVDSIKTPNDVTLAVLSGRLKIKSGMNLTGEYVYIFNHDLRNLYRPSIGFGVEFYTRGGHIFQIVFNNSNSMNEADAYASINGKWSKGQVRMGFNLVRKF